jgi:LuxR family maltose regulon positive regulatory protein
VAGDLAAARAALPVLRREAVTRDDPMLRAEVSLLEAQLAAAEGDARRTEEAAGAARSRFAEAGARLDHPAAVHAVALLARAQVLLGRPVEAAATLGSACNDPEVPAPQQRALLGVLALARLEQGDGDAALALAGRVVEEHRVDPSYPLAAVDALLVRARLHRRADHLAHAEADLEAAQLILDASARRPAHQRLVDIERAGLLLAGGAPEAAAAALDASEPVPGTPLAERWADEVAEAVRTCLAARHDVDPLSQRELEVLGLLPTRLSLHEVAGQLYVSPNTLKTHLKRVYAKLQVSHREEAVAKAYALRLLPTPDDAATAGRPAAPARPAGSSRST